MKFIKKFMDKVNGCRRRRSLVQDRNGNKKRSIKENGTNCTEQDSVVSLHSCSASGSVSAPWRADRIFVTAPPCENDWWDTVSVESTEQEDIEVRNIPPGSSSNTKRFHNCGLETWEKARAIWKRGSETNGDGADLTQQQGAALIISRPTCSSGSPQREAKELLKGLKRARGLRSYELPRRTNLKNVIDTYVTIWDGMDD